MKNISEQINNIINLHNNSIQQMQMMMMQQNQMMQAQMMNKIILKTYNVLMVLK